MLLKIIAGFFSGVIGGMGMGGGIVLIPVLTLLFNIEQKYAQGINLVSFIPAAIAALIVHIKNKNVDLKCAVNIALFGVGGSIIGFFIAKNISAFLLKKMFAVFLIFIGVKGFFSLKDKNSK